MEVPGLLASNDTDSRHPEFDVFGMPMPIANGASAATRVMVMAPAELVVTDRAAAPPGPTADDHVAVAGAVTTVVGAVTPSAPHPGPACTAARSAMPWSRRRIMCAS